MRENRGVNDFGWVALDAVLAVLGWLGAGLATLLALGLAGRRKPGERWLATGLAVAAAAMALITVSHTQLAAPWLEVAEVAVTLGAGPLLLVWVTHGVGWRPPRSVAVLALAPLALWLVAGLLGAVRWGDRELIRVAVVLQMGWSAAAVTLFVRRRARVAPRGRRVLAIGLGLLGVMHLAQLARLLAPGTTPSNLVPATLGLLLAAVTLSALRETRLDLGGGSAAGVADAEARRLVEALDAWVLSADASTLRDLTVAGAAKALDVPSVRLSRALNQGGESFPEHLAGLRVGLAERLLVDPALSHLSVEAIGVRAGFGSRSTFYAEFRRRTGDTPAEFRDRRGS